MVELNETTVLKVVAVYSGGSAKSRITSVLERIHDKVWPDVRFEIRWIRFEDLEDATVRSSMATNLCDAEILCFATRNDASPVLKQWLSSLPFPRLGHRPLIALLQIMAEPSVDNTGSDMGQFLRELARTHDLEYLPYYTTDLSAIHEGIGTRDPIPQVIPPAYRRRPPHYPPQVSSLNE